MQYAFIKCTRSYCTMKMNYDTEELLVQGS